MVKYGTISFTWRYILWNKFKARFEKSGPFLRLTALLKLIQIVRYIRAKEHRLEIKRRISSYHF